MNIGERIRKLRKTLDLTQQKFGERIGIKGNTVAQYELGRNEPIDAVVTLICREFNVSENWLRNGIGDMFLTLNRYDEISKITHQLLTEEKDSFKNRFISILANLSVEEWKVLESFAERLYENTTTSPNPNTDADATALDIDKRVEEYRRELELEARAAAGSGASENGRKNA